MGVLKNLIPKEVIEDMTEDIHRLFLDNHTRCSQHGKATVLQFLRLHLGKFGRIRRLQAKRIKSDISRVVVIAEKSEFFTCNTWLFPSNKSTIQLSVTNGQSQTKEENRCNILNLTQM